jgi:hypothetical protein
MNSKLLLAAFALSAVSAGAQANVLTQWNFNSTVPDNATGTGTTAPTIGNGTASLVGGVAASFASGSASGGSSDPALSDNSGWQTTTYAAQGTGDKTRGVQFNVNTLGYQNISVSYDLRHSNTSSRYEQVQYSLDGINFIDSTVFDGNSGDTWFNNRMIDFSALPGVSDNANFAFRILATFAPNTSTYLPSNGASNYGTAGTWRFDMVTVTGSPVPVPAAVWLLGSALFGLIGFRRAQA